jgi:hypothetical protein
MIRLIIDTYGGSHNNIFVIIDSNPWQIKIVDSFFLFDFLEISDTELKDLNLSEEQSFKFGVTAFLNFWANRIKSIETGQSKFIPFDLSDQYVEGFWLEKVKNNFKLKLVWTKEIQGNSIGKSNLDERINDGKVTFSESESEEWLISEEGIFNGLDWSLKEISK